MWKGGGGREAMYPCMSCLALCMPAVEELLRYHTASALATRRIVTKDVTIGGQALRVGEGVICSNQSANRDEAVFGPDAHKFDIFR